MTHVLNLMQPFHPTARYMGISYLKQMRLSGSCEIVTQHVGKNIDPSTLCRCLLQAFGSSWSQEEPIAFPRAWPPGGPQCTLTTRSFMAQLPNLHGSSQGREVVLQALTAAVGIGQKPARPRLGRATNPLGHFTIHSWSRCNVQLTAAIISNSRFTTHTW